MDIRFSCQSCGKRMKAADRYAGRKVPCPQCGAEVPIPSVSVESADASKVRQPQPAAPAAPVSAAPVSAAPAIAPGATPPAGIPPAGIPPGAGPTGGVVYPQPTGAVSAAVPAPPPVEEESQAIPLTRGAIGDDELDMTPMIDCVFLLLIFFLVTASFALQKSLNVPTPEQNDAARQQIADPPDEDDLITVEIKSDDTIWVNEEQVASIYELHSRLQKLKDGENGESGANKMLVLADKECSLERVVSVLDAGSSLRLESVQMRTVSEAEA